MSAELRKNDYDAIVVGSGPGGATVARELSRRGQRVLILERGGNRPLNENMRTIATILNGVRVGDNLVMGRAFTTGGTTSVYLAVADPPPMETFRALGIDLEPHYAEAEKEVPLAVLPDELLPSQSIRLRESAETLGYPWPASTMLVDQSKCKNGYSYESKWTARKFIDDAVAHGATLVNGARATKVLSENGRVTGVEYRFQKSKKEFETRQARGAKVIVAAGGAASPILLRNSGIPNVADKGFYCHPNFMVCASISGLEGRKGFGGTMGTVVDGDIHVGDGNFSGTFYRMVMLGNKQWLRAFLPSRTIGVGVMVTEGIGGTLDENGRYHKELTGDDRAKLAKGEAVARRIIEKSGGKNVFKTSLSAAHLGGVIRIKEHVDSTLETEIRNLYVCDGSVIPETGYGIQTPTITLICLGKYLAGRLAQA